MFWKENKEKILQRKILNRNCSDELDRKIHFIGSVDIIELSFKCNDRIVHQLKRKN